METSRIVLNTLVQQKEQAAGKSQKAIIRDLLPLGIHNFELRREYFQGGLDELKELVDLKLHERLVYFYSIPENLFVDHQINPSILQYIAEAKMVGANYLKMTLGDFTSAKVAQLNWLAKILPSQMELNLENDQTVANASVQTLVNFFQTAAKHGINIGFVNDLGNWVYTNQQEAQASEALLPYTRYVHLKGYEKDGGQPTTTTFVDSQLDWHKLLPQFADSLPVGLEYPASVDQLKRDLTVLKDFN